MITERRFLELPTVAEGDGHATERAAELMTQTIEAKLPGFGITPPEDVSPEKEYDPESSISRHQGLLLSAAELLREDYDLDDYFFNKQLYPVVTNSFPHSDVGYSGISRVWDEADWELSLRLHTAIGRGGARVTLLLSEPGTFATIGDDKLFHGSGDFLEEGPGTDRGYCGLHAVPAGVELKDIYNGASGQSAVVGQPEIYQWDQQLGSSVLFRSTSSIGPVALHGFRALEDDRYAKRSIHITDLHLTRSVEDLFVS